MATIDYKIFDEAKSNLFDGQDYDDDAQRVSGFQSGQDITSKIFNNVLYQCSLLTYGIAKYASDNYDLNFTFDMTNAEILTNINYFFDNFNAKTAETANTLNVDEIDEYCIPIISINTQGEHLLSYLNPTQNKSILISENNEVEYRNITMYSNTIISAFFEGESIASFNTGLTYTKIESKKLVIELIKDSYNSQKRVTETVIETHSIQSISEIPQMSSNVNMLEPLSPIQFIFGEGRVYKLNDETYIGINDGDFSSNKGGTITIASIERAALLANYTKIKIYIKEM